MKSFPALWQGTALAASLLLTSACSDTSAESDNNDERPLNRVIVVEVDTADLELERSFAARTEGSQVTEVRARVGGELESREFTEGQVIESGDAMFRIEQAPFEVDVQRAESDLSTAEAEYNEARRDWERIDNLYQDGAISGRERDQALSTYERADAELRSAQASLEDARLRFNYTEVASPIAGVAGREAVSVGNLLSEGDVLATITSLDPIYVHFQVPENDIAATYLLQNTSMNGADDEGPLARLRFSDGRQHPMEGYIDYVSRVVEQASGSIEVRAVIPNPDLDLLPGQFVRVELPRITMAHAITVPQRAIVQSGRRSVVYVADDQDIVRSREVRLGVRIGNEQVIQDGLASGDRVIVEGLSMLQTGDQVQVEVAE